MSPEAANLEAARRALAALGDWDTADWLLETEGQPEVSAVRATDGSAVLVAGGLLQDSRAGPRAVCESLAARAIPEGRAPEASLFGLGSPELARILMARTDRLLVLEPAASVARAFLSLADRSREIASGRVRLISPWSMAGGIAPPLSPLLIVHPASRRRDPAMCRAFSDMVRGRAARAPAPGESPRILVVPPFWGGTLSMGPFLKKAADELGALGGLLAWPEDLVREAGGLRAAGAGAADGSLSGAGIFRKCGRHLADRARGFRPHLILALAQAPLDAGGVDALKDACPDACAAFWFAEDIRRFGYVAGSASAWDLFLHIQGGIADGKLRDWGVRKAAYLPPCADADFFRPRRQASSGRFAARVSFMGAAYPNRVRILGDLAGRLEALGLGAGGFRIFGSGWDRAPEGIRRLLFEGGRRVTADECALIFAGSDVSLNVHSGPGEGFDPESGFVNPRAFELAAAGAFQICDPRPLMEGLFTSGEICSAPSPEALPDLVMDWLARPVDRGRIGAAARRRALDAHLYRHRLAKILRLAFGTGEESG
ncbi:MAG: glycosyltransferase [Deltaproteobacteria bacterium]|jgi:spore maturation protein CgeB|nr:glycosyltransferase [Deltaproteobacteria bacterium]